MHGTCKSPAVASAFQDDAKIEDATQMLLTLASVTLAHILMFRTCSREAWPRTLSQCEDEHLAMMMSPKQPPLLPPLMDLKIIARLFPKT